MTIEHYKGTMKNQHIGKRLLYCLFFIVLTLLVSLVSCAENTDVSEKEFDLHSDWVIFTDYTDLSSAAEYIFVGTVKDVKPSRSDSYDKKDYEDFDPETDSLTASYMMMSIYTPLEVEIETVIKGDLTVGETAAVTCPGGKIADVSVNAGGDIRPEKDGRYLFFCVKKPEANDVYMIITPIQGIIAVEDDMLIASKGDVIFDKYESLSQFLDAVK